MDNEPAFPCHPRGSDGMPTAEISYGMTLRDWFAGQALAGYFANRGTPHMNSADHDTATYCYETADAMLKARSV